MAKSNIQGAQDTVAAPVNTPADGTANASGSAGTWDRAGFAIGVALALLIGFAIRAGRVLPADFPLNDGGLFLRMVEAVRANGLIPPATVSYNGIELPFVYPPLAFAAAALLANAGVPAVETLRVLPLLANTASMAAFALLAATILRPGLAAGLATLAYTALPWSYVWLLMGGGLTRAFGLCFALLALQQAYLLATRGGRIHVVLLAVLAALTVLCHLEVAWFMTLMTGCIVLGFGRRRAAVLRLGAAALGAAVLTSPWWALVIGRHGLVPLTAAGQTGSAFTLAKADEPMPISDPGLLLVLLFLTAAFAALIAMGDRRTVVLGTLGILLLGDVRSFSWLAGPVLALPLGAFLAGAAGVLAGRLAGARGGEALPTTRDGGARAGGARRRRGRIADWLVSGLAIAIVAFVSWFLNGGSVMPPSVLTTDEREAMGWAARNTPPASRFLVITGDAWSTDRSGEWFPVLANRISVATPQGTEWLPNQEFARRIEHHLEMTDCGTRDASCLAEWASKTGRAYDAVYLADHVPARCCAPLRAALEADASYTRIYASTDATIFARR